MGVQFSPPSLTTGTNPGNVPTVPIPVTSLSMIGTTLQYMRGDGALSTFGVDAIAAVTWLTLTGKPTFGTAAAQNTDAFDAAGVAASAVAALSIVYQPLDADLTAIAALSTSTFGRSFLTLANAAAGLSILGTTAVTIDTGWTANSTVGDKTASLASYSNGLNGTMVTALNVVSGGTGTAISAAFDVLVNVVKQLAATRTALIVAKLPNV